MMIDEELRFRVGGAFMMAMVFLVNVLWYGCKSELRAKGFDVSWFWNHFSDIPNMHRLIREEQDAAQQLKYKLLLYSLYGTIAVFVFGMFVI